jgi:hypothetical protein
MNQYYTQFRSLDPHKIDFFVILILSVSFSYYIPVFLHAKCPNLEDPFNVPGHDRALQATAATIAISIPLLLESLMDINLPREITISRWMHITGLIIPNCLVMFQQDPIVYVSSGLARASILVGSLMLHMFNDPKLFTRARKLRYLSIFFALQICFQYRLYRLISPSSSNFFQILEPFIFALGLLAVSFFALTVIQMIVMDSAYDGGEKYCVYYSVCAVFAVIVFAISAILVIGRSSTKTSYLSGYNLVATLCVDSAISTFATVIPTRLARHKRDQAEVCHLHSLDSPSSR